MSESAKRLSWPSLQRVMEASGAAVRRFPEVTVCAAVAALSALAMLEAEPMEQWAGLLRTATLGMPLFVAVTLLAERRWPTSERSGALRALAGAFLIVLYLLFQRWGYLSIPQRYGHLSVTFHLFVAVAPYLGVREPRGFWQYNRALLFRFLLATLYGAAVFAGLAFALAALDNLFAVDIPDLHYPRLLCLVLFLFHPVFFLAGIPAEFEALDRDKSYPSGLRVFSQYVLLPLVALYVTILTAYMGRVLLTGSWPSGWISYLVSSLAVIGIFSLLMIHPDRMDQERSWIDRYSLGFWIAVIPSATMVLLALWQRVEQYGITERRYLLGVLAVWLIGTALYAAITRTRDIKGIPLTLVLIGVVTFVGPWSAYAVAQRSQVGRLADILSTHGALADGRISSDTVEVPFEEWEQAEAVVVYLVLYHGTSAIDQWFVVPPGTGGTADTLALPAGLQERVAGVMSELRIRSGPSDRPLQPSASDPRATVSASGFDYMVVAARFAVDGARLLATVSPP